MGTLMCPRFAPQLSIQVPDAVRVMYSRVAEMLRLPLCWGSRTVTQRSAHDDDVQATRDFATLMDRALYSPAAIWLHKQIHHTKTSKKTMASHTGPRTYSSKFGVLGHALRF